MPILVILQGIEDGVAAYRVLGSAEVQLRDTRSCAHHWLYEAIDHLHSARTHIRVLAEKNPADADKLAKIQALINSAEELKASIPRA